MEKLLSYLNALSKPDRVRFAMACGTTEGYLRKAISARQFLAVPTCVAIERQSAGLVTRKDLRPDDWAENWPELAIAPPAQRRATDPLPAPGHAGCQPPSPANILDTVPSHSVVLPAISPSLEPKEKP